MKRDHISVSLGNKLAVSFGTRSLDSIDLGNFGYYVYVFKYCEEDGVENFEMIQGTPYLVNFVDKPPEHLDNIMEQPKLCSYQDTQSKYYGLIILQNFPSSEGYYQHLNDFFSLELNMDHTQQEKKNVIGIWSSVGDRFFISKDHGEKFEFSCCIQNIEYFFSQHQRIVTLSRKVREVRSQLTDEINRQTRVYYKNGKSSTSLSIEEIPKGTYKFSSSFLLHHKDGSSVNVLMQLRDDVNGERITIFENGHYGSALKSDKYQGQHVNCSVIFECTKEMEFHVRISGTKINSCYIYHHYIMAEILNV